MNLKNEANREVRWSVALSALMIAAGLVAIIVPLVSGIAVTILVGWLLMLCGVVHLAFAWQTLRNGGLWWGVLLGILYILAGGYTLLHPMAGLWSLTVLLAACLLAAAIFEFILAFQTGSGWLLLDGVITFGLGITIWCTWPANGTWVVGTLVGISMLFGGVARLMASMAARRVIKGLATIGI